jgi:glycosyltransferase involved in cell wall biosynthesis
MKTSRLAIICDYPEEAWPSMDLAAETLLDELHARYAARLDAVRVCPPFRRRLGRIPVLRRHGFAFNADRLLNRLMDYPRHLRHEASAFDFFHVCDHSYSQVVHALPAERTGVFCHDLDAFRCLLERDRERRPAWFRAIARRTLRGLQKAALVFYSTTDVRRQIERHGLVDLAKLVHAPYGVSRQFTPEPTERALAEKCVAGLGNVPFLLHVGSCIPRKRIDVLLNLFAGVRAVHPGLRLVQVGGNWTATQCEQITGLGLESAVTQLRGISVQLMASLYRETALVLLTSEAEGFGLPIIEALACGSVVVASDLPVLREVGGTAAVYCRTADVPVWVDHVSRLLADPSLAPPRHERLAQAQRFSWPAHARTIAQAYQRLAGSAANYELD